MQYNVINYKHDGIVSFVKLLSETNFDTFYFGHTNPKILCKHKLRMQEVLDPSALAGAKVAKFFLAG